MSQQIEMKNPASASTIASTPNLNDEQPIKKKKVEKATHYLFEGCGGVKPKEIVISIAWFVAVGFAIWYTVVSIMSYIDSQFNPTTSLSLVETIPIPFPSITVCNWNAELDCEYCDIELIKCTTVNSHTGLIEECFEIDYFKRFIFQNGQNFTCYTFNNNGTSLNAAMTGYGGVISLFWKVPDIPPDEIHARKAVQVTFHTPNSVPNVFSETNFAIDGLDNFFTLTKVVTIRLRKSKEFPDLESVRWDTQLSTSRLPLNISHYVATSIAYSTLNENFIKEVVTQNLEGLLGGIAGILGVLMGIDIIKAIRGLFEIPYAIRGKTFRPIYDNFN